MTTTRSTSNGARPAIRRLLAAALGVAALTLASGALAQNLPAPRIYAPRASVNHFDYRRPIEMKWTQVRGAESYRLRVREFGSGSYWIDQAVGTNARYTFRPTDHDAAGSRFQMYVYACRGSNGSRCGAYDQFTGYVNGPPVILSSPSNGYSYTNPDRRPPFSWQSYSGFKPSSGGGNITYTVTFNASGAAHQNFQTTSTSFTPYQPIRPEFHNPVYWRVKACTTTNCSVTSRPRRLDLAGSSHLSGDVQFYQPSNGAAVDVGSQLRWYTKSGAASYRICLNMYASGCHIIRQQSAQSGSIQSYTLTSADLDAKPPFGDYYFRGKTMYWGIQACAEGNTSCVGTPSPHRSVQVAAAPVAGGGDPQVSFADDLYPTITSSACASCHSGGNLYPQRADRPAVCAASRACGAATIPFSSSISASEMRSRFMCLKACSQQTAYSQALGKIYVVPGTPFQSGLHHKAQESNAGAFGANLTIDGTTHPVREWIRIWIDQGANP